MKVQNSIDVLIVGAGAAGLTLAIDLARRGVSFRLMDKLGQPFPGSRGKGIQPRTLEILEDFGILDQMMAVGSPYPPQRDYNPDGTWVEGQEMTVAPATDQEPYRSPLMVPQFRTEAVLRARLAEFGFTPEFGWALQGFTQDDHGVFAQFETPSGIENLRCRYLIGADGGRSFIRQALQVEFPGKSLGVRAIVADLILTGLSRDVWHRYNEGNMASQLSFCPLPKTDLFQLQAPIPLEGDIDLSAAGLQAFVDQRIPHAGISIRDVNWASAYSMSARLADRYRVGNVFLIGDAAHIHPPTGGQGLNTSVQDAYNLGWKLAAVLNGSPATLLETYEEERRPIAAGMLGLATGLLDRAKAGDKRRGREVHQLDLAYSTSTLSTDVPERQTGVLAGDRAPDVPLIGAGGQKRRLFDLLQGTHWTLLVLGGESAVPRGAWGGLRIVRVGIGCAYQDPTGALSTVYGVSEGDLILIRPDGYVGAVISTAGGGWMSQYLEQVMPVAQ